VHVGPSHGEYASFQPEAATAMSYDDLKVIEASHFFRSIAEGRACGAMLEDAVQAAAVLDAITRSAREGSWAKVT
jgi:predicted dehydrogenase